MNPSEMRVVLSKMGSGPKKKLGQHFLIDKKTLETIVETADIKKGDTVLEIGPGLGVLTRALIEAGANVKAIEKDRRFVEYLNQTFLNQTLQNASQPPLQVRGGAEGRGVIVFHADATKIDWSSLIDNRSWKLIANLPYRISSFVLREALWRKDPPEKIVVLVQREVAERAIAKEGKASLLSLMVALASSSARVIRRVPPGCFYPPPKVESAVLEIVPLSQEEQKHKWGIDPGEVMRLAKKGFAHPRKFLFSNLGLKKSEAGFQLLASNFSPQSRAEDLSPEDWALLAKQLMRV